MGQPARVYSRDNINHREGIHGRTNKQETIQVQETDLSTSSNLFDNSLIGDTAKHQGQHEQGKGLMRDVHIRACQSPLPVANTFPAGLRSIDITAPKFRFYRVMIRMLDAHQSSCVPVAYTVRLPSGRPRTARRDLWTLRQPTAHRERLRQTRRSPEHIKISYRCDCDGESRRTV